MINSNIDSNIKIKKIEDLCDLPIYVHVNKFDDAAVKIFEKEVQYAENHNQAEIPILIDSFGGQVYSLLAMVDILKHVKKPIATVVVGKAMSCGAVLFSCGADQRRFVAPNATIMIHDVSSGTYGKVEDMKVDVAEADRLNKLVYNLMAKNCGHNSNYFLDIVHDKGHADWYLTADDAIFHKLANKIHVPRFNVKVSLETSFE